MNPEKLKLLNICVYKNAILKIIKERAITCKFMEHAYSLVKSISRQTVASQKCLILIDQNQTDILIRPLQLVIK